MHFKDSYVFGKGDAERLVNIFKNFFGKGRYPAFVIYNERKGHYVTKELLENNFKFSLWDSSIIPFSQIIIRNNIGN